MYESGWIEKEQREHRIVLFTIDVQELENSKFIDITFEIKKLPVQPLIIHRLFVC